MTQSFTLTVEEAPAITSATTTTFLVATAGTFTLAATGFPNPAITSAGALPTGVTFTDNGDGTATLAGTPGAGTGGTYALTLTAANGIGTPATQSFSLVVQQAPAFTSAAATTFTVASPGTFAITTSGLPAVTTIARAGTLPAGVTFTDNGNGTATLAGTPAAGTGGAYAITFTADNGVGTNATQNFTLTVHEAPAITSATTVTFPIGAPGTFTVTTTAFPVATLTRGGAALPAGVTFVDNGNGTSTLVGTPAAGSGGAYAITFTAANGIGAGAVQNFTLIVDSSPAFTSAAGTTFAVAAPGTFTVTTTGLPPPALTSTGALPAGVTFADNGNGTGTLSGTPAAGTSGSHAITFTASNGVHAPVVQNFTLTVRQAPAITSAAATTFVTGNAGTFTVTTTGFPAPGITIGGAALPAGVTWVDNGNGTGTLAGTPAAGTDGTYAITFTAANGIGANAVQSFTLTVNQAPAFTSAASTGFQVAVAGTFTVTTSGSPAITTITRGGVALPGGVTYTDNANGTATLSGTPAAGTGGSYAVTFTINNGVGGNVVQNFTLNVNQAPTITSGNADTFTVGTADSFAVTAGGLPTPTLSVAGTLPTGVTFTPGTGALAGTPTQTGTFNTIQFTAANGIVPNAVQSFTLNVVCPAITVNPATMPEGFFQVAYAGGAGVAFTQTGSTGSTITWSATGLPAGLAIGPTTGVVSGTPTNTVLNGAVSVTATDNFGCTSTRNTTIIVRPTTDNESYSGGVGNTQFVVAASVPGDAPRLRQRQRQDRRQRARDADHHVPGHLGQWRDRRGRDGRHIHLHPQFDLRRAHRQLHLHADGRERGDQHRHRDDQPQQRSLVREQRRRQRRRPVAQSVQHAGQRRNGVRLGLDNLRPHRRCHHARQPGDGR